MGRRRNRNLNVSQVKPVQGLQKPVINGRHRNPNVGLVELQADLTEKYLGAGLVSFSASLQVLHNSSADNLLCQHGYDIYRQMSQDPEVDASLDVLVQASSSQPIQAVTELTPEDKGYNKSLKYVDFINWVFNRLDIDTWRREALRAALTFGNSASEIDWEIVQNGAYEDFASISNIRLQLPEHYGYIVDRWGEIYGVAPLGTAAGLSFPLGNLIPLSSTGLSKTLANAVPRYKLSVWTWEKKGTDPRGVSILLPVYIPWWSKQRAIEEWSCWLGRYAQPSLWGTPGPDAAAICVRDASGRETYIQPTEALLKAMSNFKSASIMALPYGSELNMLQVGAGGAQPFIDSIRLFNTEITRGILGQHLATGEGENQSRAAAEVHGTVLKMLINSIRRFIAKQIQRDIIKPLIEANFGDVGLLMPVVDLGDSDGWPATITEIGVLFQAGYFAESQLAEIDRRLGMPVRRVNENSQNFNENRPNKG